MCVPHAKHSPLYILNSGYLLEHRGPVGGVQGADVGDVPAQAAVHTTALVAQQHPAIDGRPVCLYTRGREGGREGGVRYGHDRGVASPWVPQSAHTLVEPFILDSQSGAKRKQFSDFFKEKRKKTQAKFFRVLN